VFSGHGVTLMLRTGTRTRPPGEHAHRSVPGGGGARRLLLTLHEEPASPRYADIRLLNQAAFTKQLSLNISLVTWEERPAASAVALLGRSGRYWAPAWARVKCGLVPADGPGTVAQA
jgi:hypothetical protein